MLPFLLCFKAHFEIGEILRKMLLLLAVIKFQSVRLFLWKQSFTLYYLNAALVTWVEMRFVSLVGRQWHIRRRPGLGWSLKAPSV